MLLNSNIMLEFSGLALPDVDNARLEHSGPREIDQSFIHNIDSMVKKWAQKLSPEDGKAAGSWRGIRSICVCS